MHDEDVCYHAKLAGTQAAKDLGALIVCPGDGGCLWHATSHGGRPPEQWAIEDSYDLKAGILWLLRESPSSIARWLRCSEQVSHQLADEWQDAQSWADGRAFPIIAMHKQISVIVVNSTDDNIEMFTPHSSLAHIGECWIVHYEKEHYNYVHVSDIVGLHNLLQLFTIRPLHASTPSEHVKLRGGMADAMTGIMIDDYWMSIQRSVPSVSVASLPCDGLCHCINIGGIRSSIDAMLAVLGDGTHCVAMQETLVTNRGQRAIQRQAQSHGWDVIWGVPSPMTRDKRTRWRMDRNVPGVAFFFTQNVAAFPAKLRTDRACCWENQGRLQMIRCRLSSGEDMHILNVYAPAGSRHLKQRRRFIQDVQDELLLWSGAIAVMGDFQEDLRHLPIALLSYLHWVEGAIAS